MISFNHIFPISAVAPVTCESASPTGQLVLSGEGHRCAQIHLFVEKFAGGVERSSSHSFASLDDDMDSASGRDWVSGISFHPRGSLVWG